MTAARTIVSGRTAGREERFYVSSRLGSIDGHVRDVEVVIYERTWPWCALPT